MGKLFEGLKILRADIDHGGKYLNGKCYSREDTNQGNIVARDR